MATLEEPMTHPRLERRRAEIGKALKIDDPTELSAALEDIQTLLDRCGYHVRFQHFEAKLRSNATALRTLKPTALEKRRGRPKGSANWAERQFALGLAEIWRAHSGRRPTRRHNAFTGRDYGPYHAFVERVRGLLPGSVQRTRKSHVPSVDYLVRVGIEELKQATRSSDEARQRGLIEEHRWLRSDAQP